RRRGDMRRRRGGAGGEQGSGNGGEKRVGQLHDASRRSLFADRDSGRAARRPRPLRTACSCPPIGPRVTAAASGASMRTFETFPNLVTMFFTRAGEKGDAPFLWAKRDGEWRATTWAEAARQVASLAAALRAAGLQPGDRVMLVSENRPEWCLSD